MLTSADMGELFAQLQAAYGHQWAHKADAMPVWAKMLGGYSRSDVLAAVPKVLKAYRDFPPNAGQFADLVEYNAPRLTGPSSTQENLAMAERVYAYTMPQDSKKNPKGNPHGVKLPESAAGRVPGESPLDYERRIASEVTFAMYPHMRRGFQR